jgi:acyl-CoA synthetase (AMP-forming)/AMP-acid ligase II/thioesterase domain-containing protein/acyl carrier protein
MIEERVRRNPGSMAIAAPGRPFLSYARLLSYVENVTRRLNELGLGRNDRIALVLPNGPEMAVAFLAVASAATCAPLNPAYRENEFDFYLSDLNARAVIVQEGMDTPAAAVAHRRGIPILMLSPALSAEAGIFTLSGRGDVLRSDNGPPAPGDIALVLHTSGTTSRPKIVPLTQSNLCVSANNIRETLHLRETDRCLNVMPLFHIHGLVGALLSSISAGAGVVCPGGFDVSVFFDGLKGFQPTWYTAVPTIHQSILAAAEANRELISRFPLRFIRSCSAALPQRVMADLEAAFHAPVIESYGMTEASHQMSSNPLPPGIRKPGSVGLAAGPAVAVMDEAGNLLEAGQTGEVVIRGSNVTGGYENNPDANRQAFTKGWFRTGDQGYLDREGFLFLTGRLKEIINRGGLKISPREVDDALLEHPMVAQAATFAIPHPTLGEDVAAAVVLSKNGSVSEREIREFALSRLADYKAPARVLLLDEIPKGPTGKLQRTGLAEMLKDVLKVEFMAPRDELENHLKEIWQWVLDVRPIGIRDNFFDLGGHSLLAVRLFAYVEKFFGKSLPLSTLFHAPTIEELAEVIRREGWSFEWDHLVPVQPHGSRPPFFCVHPHDGDAFRFWDLAVMLGSDQPFYGLRAKILDGTEPFHLAVEDMAMAYIEEMRTVQPEGPYFLGGHCLGGVVAVEMARRLLAGGEKVALVALIFSHAPGYPKPKPNGNFLRKAYYGIATKIDRFLTMYPLVDPSERRKYFRELIRYNVQMGRNSIQRSLNKWFSSYGDSYIRTQDNNVLHLGERINMSVLDVYPGRLTLLRSQKEPLRYIPSENWGWGDLAAGGVEVHEVPGYPQNYHFKPRMRILAEKLKACLMKAQNNAM